jgi:hypothetical protein
LFDCIQPDENKLNETTIHKKIVNLN